MSFVAYSSTTVSDMSSNLILSVDIWYYLSTSNTTLTGGKWTTIPPVWEENKYYWQKTVTTYNNGTTTETKPVCITGGAGQPGTGIEKMVEEYVISNSKDTAPQTGWQEVPPKWEYGKYIWSRTKIVYKNPTSIEYTTPICDTAWEAINGIEIGGRNLIVNSTFKNYKNNGIYTFKNDEVIFSTNTFTNSNNSSPDKYRISFSMSNDFVKNVRGKTITISMDYYVEKKIIYGTVEPYIGIAISLFRNENTGGSTEYFNWYGNNTFPTNETGKWIRYSRTVNVSDYDISAYGIYIYMRDATGTVKFRHPKIEFGNKATDWTPAPEDPEEQIKTIETTLSGVHSIVNKLDKTITDKVWQDDITTKINQYDGTVTESVRSRVTETEKNLKGIQSTVKDMETTVSKKADGSTVETLNTRLTKAEQDANGFKTTVQDYFSTTDKTLNGIQSWKTEVNQKISKDGILSTVGDYYATQDDLNNLNVGGSNLINKTDVQALNNTSLKINGYTFNISGQVTSSNFDGVFISDTIFQKDEFYVFSYKFTVKSGSVTKIGGHQAAFTTVKAVVDGIEYKTEYDAGYPLDSKKTEHTVVVYLKYHGIGDDKKLYIQPNRQGGSVGTWNLVLTELQIEKGNTKTAWSPSYQDMMNDIQIGATNLITNSSFEKQGKGWYSSYPQGTQFVKEGKDGNYCVKITGKYNQYSTVQTEQTFTVKSGETYTLSSFTKSKDIVKGTTNYFVSLYVAFYDKNNKWVAEEQIQNGNMPLSTDWIKNVMTFTVPDISTINYMKIAGFSRDFIGTLWWDDFKLEKGNKATDWTPAPEDIYDDINSIKIGSRNFLRNGNFAETTTSPGNTNKHHNLYPLGWGGYNGGIDNPTTSWHAHIDNTTFGFNVVEFNESDGNRNWKGLTASPDFIFIEKVDQEYRLSVDVYATGSGTKLTGGFYYCKKGESTQNFHSGRFEIRPKETNKWVRMSVAVPLKDDIDLNSKKTNLYIYGYDFDSNSILYIKDAALTTGNKTADWTPAPEETNMQIANVETIANQTKDKFTWLVKSGTSSTNFELTDRAATLVANYINLKGLVTFAGLNSDTQGKISSAKSTADAVTSLVNANKTNWDKGYAWTSSNGGNMSKMLDMVKTWTDGALTTTTTINGGFIRTNTINASHLTLGDFTNLVDVNESLPQSAVPDNTHPFGSHAKPICKNGYWYKESAASEYLALSSYKPNSFTDGDELYYEFTAHSELAGNYFIALWFYNGASKEFQTMKRGNIESVTTSDKTFSGIIKLEDAKKYDFFAIGICDNNNTHVQIYAKNISVRKKTNASLIVDGSIVGKHIAANTIDASKIQIGNLNNICVVNPDTYNPYGLAVIESHGQKYFRLGANTDSSTPRYISLPLRRNISSNTYYPVGDCWKFRAYGYQTVAGVAYTFCIRVFYTDGNNTNLGTCRLDPPVYNPGYFEGICQITTKPIAGKPISHFEIFIETGHKKSYYLYLRDITIYSMTNATLLEDGSVTTDKLTTSNIVGTNGWINLRSGTFNYGNGKFVWNGSTLTINGSGSFSGTITSSAGTIGGWSINGSSIYRGSGYNVAGSMYFGTSGLSISNKFRVDANGNVTMSGATMTGANVSGTITSSAGTIGGWSINGSSIYRGSADYNSTTGMYFGTSGLRLGASFKVNNTGYATINGGTFTGTINAETGKISGWRLLSSRLVSLDVDVQNETDFKNKGTKAVYLAKYNYNGQGSLSAIGVQTRTSTSNTWVNRIDIRYDGSMIFKNQNDVIVTKFNNGNWSDIGTISCNDVIIKQNAKSYKLSHRMLVCDDTANVLGVGMTTSGDRFIPMKDKKADYAHGKIAIGSNQNRFSEVWSVKALNTSSDRNLKTNLSSFDERFENFFMDLNTCTFMYKNFTYDDTHDRLHWGIDAQQAEQALIKNSITLGEAGFLCIDNLEYPNAAGQMKEYSVRYSELIGLNIHMTQKSYARIKELEKQNQELEKRIAILEARLN